MSYWDYPTYVSVAEKRAKAARQLKRLTKKHPAIQPIVIEGRTIAQTWWGKSWNQNLERYADYRNRIGRGRSYVRHGAVLDLQISPGQVDALVQGSRARPYAVLIRIKGIEKSIWQNMKAACADRLDSLQELLAGKFPKSLGEIFTTQGHGLFPLPREIEFNCSCPDWASMCKHVAATLYGIGARLDEDPSLFFKLRKVKMDDLIQQAIHDQSYKLLEKAEKTSPRMIAESDLAGMFGIDMDMAETKDFDSSKTAQKMAQAGSTPSGPTRRIKPNAVQGSSGIKALTKKTSRGALSQKTGLKKDVKPSAAKATSNLPAGKSRGRKKAPKVAGAAKIVNIIRRSKKGVDVLTLKQKTGFGEKKIRNIIYKAHKQGVIERVGRGLFVGVQKKS
jgi:uncharacterized Zn finger protein